jgi:hypothetical protein
MSDWSVLEEDSFDYDGPLALCDGEGEGEEGGGGGDDQSPEWTKALPQDVRGWDEVKNSDSPEKFWDQMVNMRSRMGSSIRLPGKDAGDEDRNAFYTKVQEKVPGLMKIPDFDNEDTLGELYQKLGRPAEAKDYTIPELKNSKGEAVKNINMDTLNAFKDQAFKAGMTQKQFNNAVVSFVKPGIDQMEKTGMARTADKEALSSEWGAATERNSKMVENYLKHTDAPEAVLKAVANGSADKNSMLWFHKLASQSMNSNSDFQSDDGHRGVMTPAEATIKASEIRNNKKHPYNNKRDPGHAAAKKYMRELYLLKNPQSGNTSAPGSNFSIGG